MAEHGPFDRERDAMSTQAAARLRAVYDAATDKVGCTEGEALAILLAPCEGHGIPLGDWDRRVLRGFAHWEDATVISVAALIERAWEAGRQAALEAGGSDA